MLVLLPPSEGKATPKSGRPVDLDQLSLPELSPVRARVLDALVDLCAGDTTKARTVLGLSEGQAAEVEHNARLRHAPTLPAGRLYTGVLYDALDLASLDAPARRRADRSLLVFSGLWGAVRLRDRIPAYRCSMAVRLPGIGGLGAYWRTTMQEAVTAAAGSGLVLDLRSSTYAAAWAPVGDVAGRTATVRVLHEREVDGAPSRTVVSHFNKATKGRLVRDLLRGGARPRRPADLVNVLRDLGYTVETQPPASGRPWRLDVVVSEI